MENTNSKFITVSFMITAVLIGIVVSVMAETTAAVATGAFGRAISGDLFRHGFPVLIGLLAYLLLQFNKTVVHWADEVVTELRRIVWPSRRDTMAMTFVVCIMLVISGVTLGLFDVVSGTVIDWLLRQNILG